jgi:hypothetical protein
MSSNEHSRTGRSDPMTVRTVAVAVAEPVELAEPTTRSAQQVAEDEGLTFAGTPGPGYSEGGDVYEPKAASRDPLGTLSRRRRQTEVASDRGRELEC